jgi:cysteine desulfurase / selenocysteine lyase
MFRPQDVRAQFPILKRRFNDSELVYLDSAATTLKPVEVVEQIANYYLMQSANVHRGAYALSNEATTNFEHARAKVAEFIHAKNAEEIVFTRGTTEAINLVANSWGDQELKSGDTILLTQLEHHANIVPWQMLAERKKLKILVADINATGELDEDDFNKKITQNVKLFAFTACSNTLGTNIDVKKFTKIAHQHGAYVLVDAAQAISQEEVFVQNWDIDFLVFSGHKLFGPTGVGVLYSKIEILNKMQPWQGGGSMISKVDFAQTTYNDAPFRFEAGTPHIEGVLGLQASMNWFARFNRADILKHEQVLLDHARQKLDELGGVIFYEHAKNKAAILSFNIQGAHHSDVAQILDQNAVAVRAGHHCTQPLMKRLGVSGTLRASFSIYNNLQDVEALVAAVKKAKELLL